MSVKIASKGTGGKISLNFTAKHHPYCEGDSQLATTLAAMVGA